MIDVDALLDGLPALNGHATDRESLEFLFGLLAYIRPKLVVEAGTYQGHFAVAAARLLPDATIYTADPFVYHDLPLIGNLVWCHTDFALMMEEEDLRPDFAFIDSGPPMSNTETNDVRLRHWRCALDHTVDGGIVACHDMKHLKWEGGDVIARTGVRLLGGRGLSLAQVRL